MLDSVRYKQCVIKEVDTDDELVVAKVTDESVDRIGEVVSVKGLELDNYRKNSVLLFGHSHGMPPVGKAEWIRKRKATANRPADVLAGFRFADTEMGRDLYKLCRDKILTAFSIGLNPVVDGQLMIEQATEDDQKRYGKRCKTVVRKADLLEVSIVPVPMNPNAVVQEKEGEPVSRSSVSLCLEVAKQEEQGLICKSTAKAFFDMCEDKDVTFAGPPVDSGGDEEPRSPGGGEGGHREPPPPAIKVARLQPKVQDEDEDGTSEAVERVAPEIIRCGVDVPWLTELHVRKARGEIVRVPIRKPRRR